MKEQLLPLAKKKQYKPPLVELIWFECTDIITTSGGDENQGEWDPQTIDGLF